MSNGEAKSVMWGFDSVALDTLLKETAPPSVLLGLISAAFGLRAVRAHISLTRPSDPTIRRLAIIAALLLPVAWRLTLLPVRAIPAPKIHDEFVHLLTADTLASGRLANPPHPLWRNLDTIYVLQRPAYAGIYPIGQGAILAAGKIIAGNAWFGIVIASALMCAAITWALFDLLPVTWAAMGALPVVCTYALGWIDSYWGGSFCAFGGALLFGALLRLRRSPSAALGLTAGFGWSIVWLIRPFESILLFLVLWASIAAFAIRARGDWRRWIAPVALVVLIQTAAGGVTLLQNRAVTGSYTKLPYTLSQEIDGVPQSLAWQKPVAPPKFRFPEMKGMYDWQLQQKTSPEREKISILAFRVWEFFITPWFVLPLLLSLFAIRDRLVGAAWALVACALAAALLYSFFYAHYIAAYCCVFAFLIVRGLMVLDTWSWGGVRIGRWAALFVMLGGFLQFPVTIVPFKEIIHGSAPAVNTRQNIAAELERMGGKHVVFVRYGRDHEFHDEWVYNDANIDESSIVWCRWMGPNSDSEVMRYYPQRRFWIVDVGGKGIATNLSTYPMHKPPLWTSARGAR